MEKNTHGLNIQLTKIENKINKKQRKKFAKQYNINKSN